MKLLLFFILFTCVLCDDSRYCGRSTSSVCDLREQSEYEKCLCDLSASQCDLNNCLKKYKSYSTAFKESYIQNMFGGISINPDAYTEVDLAEILTKTILRCHQLLCHDASANVPDNFIENSLSFVPLINEWICVQRKVFVEVKELCNKLDKEHGPKYSKSLRKWIQTTRETVEETDQAVRNLFVFNFDVSKSNEIKTDEVNLNKQ